MLELTGVFATTADYWLLALALVTSAATPLILANRLAARGSDQFVHLYFIKHLRRNGGRLFTSLPDVLNHAPCAYPLFLHRALSWFPARRVEHLGGTLTALASCLLAAILYVSLKWTAVDAALSAHAGAITLAVAATPQLFHLFNARVTGISARPIGWTLFFVHWLSLFFVMRGVHPWPAGGIAVVSACLIWGTSMFAMQGLVLFAAAYAVVFRDLIPAIAAAVGLVLFVVLNPRYGPDYVKQYLRYTSLYARIWAGGSLLKRRHSVWRDLIADIWKRLATSVTEGLQYAYGNTVVILIALNPFVFASVYYVWHPPFEPFLAFSARLGTVALIVTLITSFRQTRFLGEPERYAELAVPFTGTLGAWAVLTSSHDWVPWAVVAYFGVMNIGQVAVAFALARRAPQAERLQIVSELPHIAEVINGFLRPDQVRFLSNDEDVTKYLLLEDWRFVWFWPTTDRYGGMTFHEAFSLFPFVRKESLERLIETFDVNVCLLNRSNFGTIFDVPGPFRSVPVLDTPRYVVCRIERVSVPS